MQPDFKGLLESAGRFYLAASAVDSNTRMLAYRPLDGEALSRLTGGVVAVTILPLEGSGPDVDVRVDLASGRCYITRDGVERPLETSETAITPSGGFLDKVLENAAGEQFETARLSALLIEHPHQPLDDLIKVVTDHLTRWIHHPETREDITLVLARKRPAAR